MHPIALIDCNNFFVSCERLFRPELLRRPVLVLSSNDGCVVSRSDEVKALGIKMGEPYFKVRALCEANGVTVFSSNFELYRDLSRRVMHTLRCFSDLVEVYSIDEAFAHCEDIRDVKAHVHTEDDCRTCNALRTWGCMVRRAVFAEVGIPVSVGIAETKTLAKVATHLAKQRLPTIGDLEDRVYGAEVLCDARSVDAALAITEVGEVWGIGWRRAPLLTSLGIRTAADLVRMEDRWVRAHMSVCGLRTVHELRRVRCFSVGQEAALRKTLLHSQSFVRPVTNLASVRGAIVYHVRKVAEILRAEGACAREVCVFIRTSRHTRGEQYAAFDTDTLTLHTNDTLTLSTAACAILARIYKPGVSYAKAGVLVRDIVPLGAVPPRTLFGENVDTRAPLMRALDTLRQRFGDRIHIASETREKTWEARHELLSPRYTCSWGELAKVSVTVDTPSSYTACSGKDVQVC